MLSRRRIHNPYVMNPSTTASKQNNLNSPMMSYTTSNNASTDSASDVINTTVLQQLPTTTATTSSTSSSSSASATQQPPSYAVTKSQTSWLTQRKADSVRRYIYGLSLHRTLFHENLLDVPFPSQSVMGEISEYMRQQQHRASSFSAKTATPETTLFFGCLPRNCPKLQLAALMMLLCNVIPIDIRVHAGANGRNAGCAHVVVRSCDADKVIAGLHKRVLFDEACWIYAQDERAIQVMHKYCAMLENDQTVRFQSRPYTSLVVMPGSQHVHQQQTQQSHAAAAAASASSHTAFQQQQQQQEQQQQVPKCCFSDLYHPMCTSLACIQYREQNTDLSVLHGIYLEHFAAEVNFGECIPVHSMPPVDKEELSRWKAVTPSHLSNANKRAATAWGSVLANKGPNVLATPRLCSQHCPAHQQHEQAQC